MPADWALRDGTHAVVITKAVNSEATTTREHSSSLNFHNPFSGSLSAWTGTPANQRKEFYVNRAVWDSLFFTFSRWPMGSVQGFSMRVRQDEESASESSKSLRDSCSAAKYLHSSLTRRSGFCGSLNLNPKDSTSLTVRLAAACFRYQARLM
jgi:hypothetical protein